MTAPAFDSLAELRHLALSMGVGDSFDRWFLQQVDRTEDPAFVAAFSDHFSRFPVFPQAFAHRLVRFETGHLLGGIRFFGGDPDRPFVEVIGWSGPNPDALAAEVRDAWAPFHPESLRLLVPTGTETAGARIDQHIHAAPVGAMSPPEPGSTTTLERASDPAAASRHARERYADLTSEAPDFGGDLAPLDEEKADLCSRGGTLDWFLANGERVGLLASLPDAVAFLHGHVVMEVVVSPEHGGRGHARNAHRLLAARFAADDPDRLMLGTIDSRNHRSRAAAEAAGRPAVLSFVFVDLP